MIRSCARGVSLLRIFNLSSVPTTVLTFSCDVRRQRRCEDHRGAVEHGRIVRPSTVGESFMTTVPTSQELINDGCPWRVIRVAFLREGLQVHAVPIQAQNRGICSSRSTEAKEASFH
ncbi:hypothetical protein ARMSODRAFT_320724 [Armillaria solidipes]|uniref:Secreted protein n=1 Tax=Armillaria solidipes TaxID=1076256 RepID=A0A2H3B8E9_9AGAR|nr:hypothetical protein ARMSODRAFT_320724 [Armillaria solidipes]